MNSYAMIGTPHDLYSDLPGCMRVGFPTAWLLALDFHRPPKRRETSALRPFVHALADLLVADLMRTA